MEAISDSAQLYTDTLDNPWLADLDTVGISSPAILKAAWRVHPATEDLAGILCCLQLPGSSRSDCLPSSLVKRLFGAYSRGKIAAHSGTGVEASAGGVVAACSYPHGVEGPILACI
mmetsp:Transcript_2650/g.3412  ORF Transcript_2650/g.3412 Transcript_2650/m.3412 type:complete len:116 (+) Transcript_2650:192-539(+)